MEPQETREALQACELFAPLSEQDVELLATSVSEECEVVDFAAGDAVFNQGQYCTKLHVILDGQVVLERSFTIGDRTARKWIAILGRGRAMGWSSILYGPRDATATAVCRKPTRILTICSESLRTALESDPATGFRVMERLACLLADRVRGAYTSIEGHF